jgi:hypothetical protein
VAAGASPTGGIGGIFYFILLLIGLVRRSYGLGKKSIASMKHTPTLVLIFSIVVVVATNVVFVYKFVQFQPGTVGSGIVRFGSGVQVNWQLPIALLFGMTLLSMFLAGFILLRDAEKHLRYRLGWFVMLALSIILLLWLPLGILDSLHFLHLPF